MKKTAMMLLVLVSSLFPISRDAVADQMSDFYKAQYSAFKNIKSFNLQIIPCDNESSSSLTIHRQLDFAKLYYLSKFTGIPLRDEFNPISGKNKKTAAPLGYITIYACTVKGHSQIAYSVRLEAGSIAMGDIYMGGNCGLGISNPDNIETNFRKAIESTLDQFAILFYKSRGEM